MASGAVFSDMLVGFAEKITEGIENITEQQVSNADGTPSALGTDHDDEFMGDVVGITGVCRDVRQKVEGEIAALKEHLRRGVHPSTFVARKKPMLARLNQMIQANSSRLA